MREDHITKNEGEVSSLVFSSLILYVYIYVCLHWVFTAACALFLVAVLGLLTVLASLVVEHRL